jgi:hypothetical protein
MLPHLCAGLLLLAQAAPAPGPSPSPSPTPVASPTPPAVPQRLRLDIARHVDSVLREQDGTPRFETSLEVLGRPPDIALEEALKEYDLECGPAGGPPTAAESMEFRPHPAQSLDLAALARAVSGTLGNPGPPRYFLYRVQGQGEVEYLLREEELRTAPGQQPSTAFVLVASFPDLASAVSGFRRMTRGFGAAERADQAEPLSPWQSQPCRLRPRRP